MAVLIFYALFYTTVSNRSLGQESPASYGLPPVSEFEELKKPGGSNMTQRWLVAGAGHISSFSKAPDEYSRRVTAFFKEELQ